MFLFWLRLLDVYGEFITVHKTSCGWRNVPKPVLTSLQKLHFHIILFCNIIIRLIDVDFWIFLNIILIFKYSIIFRCFVNVRENKRVHYYVYYSTIFFISSLLKC